MGPVIDRVQKEAIAPYLDGHMTATVAMDKACSLWLRDFMLGMTRDPRPGVRSGAGRLRGLTADQGPSHPRGDPGFRDPA